MAERQKTRVVLAGCGSMSASWLRAGTSHPDVEMVGLVDLNADAARSRAEEFGLQGAAIGSDLEAVLRDTAADVVFDCTIPEAHHRVTLTALAHGCHVLGEKPLADSMERAREMVAAAEAAGKLYAVIQNRRYDPRIRRLRAFLDSGVIGSLTTLNSDFYLGAHFGGFRDRMEHVLLLDMAIHSFDQARLISGADPVSVYCKEWNPQGSWYDHDASAIAIFEMTSGVVYTYRGSWCAEGLNTSWECEWRMVGTQGAALWDGGEGMRAEAVAETGAFKSAMREVEIPDEVPAERIGGHQGLIGEFIRCVREGGAPETVCTDNIKSLAMVFGAIESAEKGRPVEIRV